LLALLLGVPVLLGLLPKQLQQPGAMPPAGGMPPIVEVRRALPVVPRALPVTVPTSLVSDPQIGRWQTVRFLDGRTMQICYGGRLASSAFLPEEGKFIGDARVIDNHCWIWMTPAGASFPSWVDP
jgi:hypothetical protein